MLARSLLHLVTAVTAADVLTACTGGPSTTPRASVSPAAPAEADKQLVAASAQGVVVLDHDGELFQGVVLLSATGRPRYLPAFR